MHTTLATQEGREMVTLTAPQPVTKLVTGHTTGQTNGQTNGTNGSSTAVKHTAAVVAESTQLTPLCTLLIEQGFDVDLLRSDDLIQGAAPRRSSYDVVMFDIHTFDARWQEACTQLRAKLSRLPIVVLCEQSSIADRIRGFESGADEFVDKPYSAGELTARLKALLRRAGSNKGPNGSNGHSGLDLRYGDLVLDLASRVAYRGEYRIDLSRREFALLSYFVQNAEEVLNRERILQNVWGTVRKHDSNVVDVYVNYLRNKTEQGKHARLIHTIRRKGYVLSERPLT